MASKSRVLLLAGLAVAVAAGFVSLTQQAQNVIRTIASAVWGS